MFWIIKKKQKIFSRYDRFSGVVPQHILLSENKIIDDKINGYNIKFQELRVRAVEALRLIDATKSDIEVRGLPIDGPPGMDGGKRTTKRKSKTKSKTKSKRKPKSKSKKNK